MTGFSEAWLKEYESRRQAVTPRMPDVIGFTLTRWTIAAGAGGGKQIVTPAAGLLTQNQIKRMHWSVYRHYQQRLSDRIAHLTGNIPKGRPFDQALVKVVRYSVREVDRDGLFGALKPLLDSLVVRSSKHPDGLGFIIDDAPSHMRLEATSEVCRTQSEQRTVVIIEKVSD